MVGLLSLKSEGKTASGRLKAELGVASSRPCRPSSLFMTHSKEDHLLTFGEKKKTTFMKTSTSI